jgi:hypothetical protein
MDPRAIVGLAVGVIIAGAILSSPIAEEQVMETYYTSEPYTYKQSFIRENQVRTSFLWLKEVTQTQFMVKNTDMMDGTFLLNFVFDNGVKTETDSKKIKILAGEQKSISINSPLSGKSSANLTVIPPNKTIPQQHTVAKKITGWEYLWRLMPFIK